HYPGPRAFKMSHRRAGLNYDGSPYASEPSPAVEAGWSSEGWVDAVPDATNSGAVGNYHDLFKVTKNADGSANVGDPTCVSTPSYAPPPPAPQAGSVHPLDTLDGRLTHAVAAIDPRLNGGAGDWALWTSHSVSGGAGSQSQWYEVDVHHSTLVQSGDISDPNLYVFNAGVSDDRAATGATSGKFGDNMVAGVTTSSSSTYPAVAMVSKRGSGTQSPARPPPSTTNSAPVP